MSKKKTDRQSADERSRCKFLLLRLRLRAFMEATHQIHPRGRYDMMGNHGANRRGAVGRVFPGIRRLGLRARKRFI